MPQLQIFVPESSGRHLGIDLSGGDSPDAHFLAIDDVRGGALRAWNVAHPLDTVRVGDRVVQVNGRSGARAMREELCGTSALELLVVMSVPEIDEATGLEVREARALFSERANLVKVAAAPGEGPTAFREADYQAILKRAHAAELRAAEAEARLEALSWELPPPQPPQLPQVGLFAAQIAAAEARAAQADVRAADLEMKLKEVEDGALRTLERLNAEVAHNENLARRATVAEIRLQELEQLHFHVPERDGVQSSNEFSALGTPRAPSSWESGPPASKPRACMFFGIDCNDTSGRHAPQYVPSPRRPPSYRDEAGSGRSAPDGHDRMTSLTPDLPAARTPR